MKKAAVGGSGHAVGKHPKQPHHETAKQHHLHVLAAKKAARTRKHNAALHGKHASKKHAKRGLALAPADVACCAAEALAASLRLTGRPVSDPDVLAVYGATAGCPDAGASIVATFDAISDRGLAGVFPVSFGPVDFDDPAAVILGVDLPGPHTVTVSGDDWLTWGGRYDPAAFPAAIIEEAWAITWP